MKDRSRNKPTACLLLAAMISTLDSPASSFVTQQSQYGTRRSVSRSLGETKSYRYQLMDLQTFRASTVSTVETDERKDSVSKKKQEAGPLESATRTAAMKLHTREQAPKEGEKEVTTPAKPFVPTINDYVQFLVDSQYVYQTFEDIVNNEKFQVLSPLRQTGLERVEPLEKDLNFIRETYNVDIPKVGSAGLKYAATIQALMEEGNEKIPEFICHYYNHYFAHTAGGRMIGKKMSSMLLDGKTLEFYKWDGDINKLKQQVKNTIEDIAQGWDESQREACVGATGAAFEGGGALNSYLFGGSGH